MDDRRKFIDKYWKYYLLLEEKFINLTRYVEPEPSNYKTYSLEMVNQLLNIGSEVDVVMKKISGFQASDHKNIGDYFTPITTMFSDITSQEVVVFGISLKPFAGWDQSHPAKSLDWWEAYNGVKHGRADNYTRANFEMVIKALVALCLIEVLYIQYLSKGKQLLDRPDIESQICNFPNIVFEYDKIGKYILGVEVDSKNDPAEVDTLVFNGGGAI